MNKQKILIFISFLIIGFSISGCVMKSNTDISHSIKGTDLSLEESTVFLDVTQKSDNDTVSETEQQNKETNNALDGEGMIPLLLTDTSTDSAKAILICAGNNGEVYRADQFAYDGEPLYSTDGYGRLDDVDRLSTTKILDIAQELQFIDSSGKTFTAAANSMTTTGRTYESLVMAHAHLTQELPKSNKYYVGSYCGVDMFPAEATYTDNSVIADLDRNGISDKIQWTLTKQNYVEDKFLNFAGYYYTYEVTAQFNGEIYTVCSSFADYDKVAQGDIQAFLADVDMDGEFEIIVYKKALLRYDNVYIYDYNGTGFTKSISYIISPM